GTQLVFCDTSTPNGKVGFNAYDELKNILVNHHGIPSEDIAYIHSAKNSDQKKSLFEKVRNGQIRILLASTSKCGAGTNIQDKLIALHHLDCPYRPSDIEQREGRILRQGNKNDEVSIYRYVTEKSFDAYLWNIVETKQRFISQIMSSKTDIRHCEDVDEAVLGYAEAQAIASGNPLIKEKIEVETEVSRLRLLETQHRNQLFKLQDDVQTTYPKEISGLQRHISLLEQDISSLLLQPSQDEFLITLGNNTQFTEREQAGKALAALAQSTPLGCDKAIGKYLGFTVSIRSENYFSDKKLVLTGAAEYTCEFNPHSGLGNITRIENLAKGIERKSQAAKLSLEDTYKSLHTAQTSMNKPFELSENLKLAVERLTELEQLLDLTNKDDDVVEIEVENLTEEVESDYDLEP
ncbi:MAG: helicase C-terminal domain-containing protein, partial [Oscillospiraceae bacterium]